MEGCVCVLECCILGKYHTISPTPQAFVVIVFETRSQDGCKPAIPLLLLPESGDYRHELPFLAS